MRIIMLSVLVASSVGAFGQTAPFSSTSPWILDHVYTDQANGFSFRYPSAWKPQTSFGYHPPALSRSEGTKVGFGGMPVGRPRRSNLEGLGMVYRVQPGASRASCNALAVSLSRDGNPDDGGTAALTLDGVAFDAHETEEAGMSQSTSSTLYSGFREGRCYFFETAISIGSGLSSENPKLYPEADAAALGKQLDAIVRSIRFSRPSRNAPSLTRFRSDDSDISFDFPTVWQPLQPTGAMLAPVISGLAGTKPRGFSFSPAGNVYEHTNLVGLSIAYILLPARNYDECSDYVKKVAPNAAEVDGGNYTATNFAEFTSSRAAACHQVHRTFDATLLDLGSAANRCVVFERDFETRCADVVPGQRALTDVETKALQKHLDDVMQTIVLR